MEVKSGGLSKGCLIGIIIASALLFLLIVTGITCYVYRDDLAKWAATFSVDGLKGEVAKHPEVVDTTKFNILVDAFIVRVKADTLDKRRYADFMLAMQPLASWLEDKKLDSTEIMKISDVLVNYFPDLDSLRPIAKSAVLKVTDSASLTIPMDTAATR